MSCVLCAGCPAVSRAKLALWRPSAVLGLGLWRTFKCSASLALALAAAALPLFVAACAVVLYRLVPTANLLNQLQ